MQQRQTQHLYEQDFNAWAVDTASKLKSKAFDDVDWSHLIEEVEDMSIRQKHSLKSRLVVLLAHLLKWQYQSGLRCGSWRGTIREQRRQIRYLLIDSPSLKNELIALLQDKNIFKDVLRIVLDETKINPRELPKANIYNYDDILNADFYPDE